MSSSSSLHTQSSSLIPSIRFFLYLFIAQLWKYFVFPSPFIYLTRSLFPLTIAAFSNLRRIFLKRSSSFRTLLNTFLFHQFRSFPHFSIFARTFLSPSASFVFLQVAWTTSSQPKFGNHICLNRNIFFREGSFKPENTICNGQWSKESHLKCWTLEPGNFKNQLLVAKPRSSLSQIKFPFS